jgi:type I restriction enzyme S subunit
MSKWPVAKLDDLTRRGSGHTPSKSHPEYWNGGVKWVSLRDTFRLDRGLIDATEVSITRAGLAHSSAVLHPRGTVLLLRDAGIGKSGIIADDMAVSQHFIAWVCGPQLHNWYLYYLLQSWKAEFERISNGSTIKTIGLDYFRQLQIPLPPMAEQLKIAEILQEVDSLIGTIESSVTKKRAIKQGMMQELLAGTNRLPEFSQPWTPVILGDVGETYGGLVGKTAKDFGHGSGRYVTFTEVMRDARLRGSHLVNVDVKKGERQSAVRIGDVLFNGSSETPEEVALAAAVEFSAPNVFLNSFCFGYRPDRPDVIDPLFLAHFFRAAPGRQLVASLAQGSTRYNIAKTKLMSIPIELPKFAEQQAIAGVLHDADAEIEALNLRLESTRAVKQGMMQELLTGRTRLLMEATK